MLTPLSRMLTLGLKWALGIILCTGLGYVAVRYARDHIPIGQRVYNFWIKQPKNLSVDDFQRPLDRDFLAGFLEWDQTRSENWISGKILLPYFDDVMKRQLSADAVELGAGQRKDIARIVESCAGILGMPVPRIYARPENQLNAAAGGFVDPVLMLDPRFLNGNWSDRQLRAVMHPNVPLLNSNSLSSML